VRSRLGLIAIAAVVGMRPAAAQPAASIDLHFVSRDIEHRAVTGEALFVSPSTPPVERRVPIVSGHAVFHGAGGSVWTLRAAGGGAWWFPDRSIACPAAGLTTSLDVAAWPLGVVTAQVALPDAKSAPPKSVRLVVESPPTQKTAEIPRGSTFDCTLSPEKTLRCAAPAATLDIAIRASDFAPVYRWSVAVRGKGETNVAPVTLRRGASVLAWLDPRQVGELKQPPVGRLMRMFAQVSGEASARLATPVAEGAFSKRGMIQLLSVPAGSYVLEVRASGFAPARAFPIEVFEGRETSIRRPIELRPPITVRLLFDPPTDASNAPWTAEVFRSSDFGSGFDPAAAVRKRADSSGRLALEGQMPGNFRVIVSDHAGNTLFNDQERISIGRFAVHGKVTLGGKPLPGTLWFGRREGAITVKAPADEDGSFSAALPRRGPWPVEVVSSDGAIDSIVSVVVPERGDVAIEIPDTTITGWVVDAAGERVANAEVSALSAAGAPSTSTDARGEFAIHGAPTGAVVLTARDRKGRNSGPVSVQVADGSRRDGVELKFLKKTVVVVHVMSGSTPVVGATLASRTLDVQQTQIVRATTDIDGKADLAIPEGARRANIVVAAPGHALQAFTADLTTPEVVLPVQRNGGNLVIRFPADHTRFTLAQNSAEVLIPDLLYWTRAHGLPMNPRVLEVPDMAAGSYVACLNDAGGVRRCAQAMLAIGGAATLDLGAAGAP
jgi:hypothetical protein